MYHRYGRHGPHAWKRRHERKRTHFLPALVPPTAIVSVPIQQRERIIIIVIDQFGSGEERDPIQLPTNREITPTEKDPRTNRAELQAFKDMKTIGEDIRRNHCTAVLHATLQMLAEKRAEQDTDAHTDMRNPDIKEYIAQQAHYTQAYLAYFYEHKTSLFPDLAILPDEVTYEIIQKATADRKKYTFQQAGKGPFHKRDLAVVSVLHQLGLCQNMEEYLERIHPYTDLYDDVFRDPKEVRLWNYNQQSF